MLLLVGAWHDDECKDDADYAWCRAHPGFVWLGARSDEEAARLILCADVGIVPFKVEPFNDAGLPYRILKYARLGRRTVTPELAGVRTWAQRRDDRRRRRRVRRRAARAGRAARTGPDLALRDVGAGADRRPPERAAVGSPAALGIASELTTIEIIRGGEELLDELRPLWLALRDHHHAVAPDLGPVRERRGHLGAGAAPQYAGVAGEDDARSSCWSPAAAARDAGLRVRPPVATRARRRGPSSATSSSIETLSVPPEARGAASARG